MTTVYRSIAKKAITLLLLGGIFFTLVPAEARVPSDPEYTTQQALWEQIRAPLAWDFTTGSRDVVVAVIDTGVDTWHDDLRNNIWTNPYEVPENNRDDDKNGYIDDLHGWNFVENTSDVRTSVQENSDDPEAVRHGTIIAGLIGAEGENGEGGVGLNWHVKLMPLRSIQSDGSGDYPAVIKAVDYAIKNGADIITMSFIGDINDTALRDRLKAAYDQGILVVAAAGNHARNVLGDLTEKPMYPACYDRGDTTNWLLTVGSVNFNDELSGFSNFGDCIDIMAPGEQMMSTERYAPQFGYTKKFGGPWKGTSFAAPLVAGTAALIKSLHSEWKAAEITETILNTADPIELQNIFYRTKIGRGRLNVGKAVGVAAQLKGRTSADGYYYYLRNNTIQRLNFTTSQIESVATSSPGLLRQIAVYNPNYSTKNQLVTLVEGKPFYYIRLFKDSGELIREFSLEFTVSKDTVVRRLQVTPLPNAPGRFVVEVYYPKKKQTIFKSFNDVGELQAELKFAGQAAYWSMGRTNADIVVAEVTGSSLKIRRMSWNGEKPPSLTILKNNKGSMNVEALRVGRVFAGEIEQAILIVRRGRRIEQLLVNLTNGVTKTTVLAETSSAAPWRLLLADSTASENMLIFPFSTGGGIFRLASDTGESVAEIKTPALKGITD